MCVECWEQAGSPTLWTPAVEVAVNLVCDLYELPDCATGGPLHVVVDDWNLEGTIRPYLDDHDWSPEAVDVATHLAAVLNALTDEGRYSALGHADGHACVEACTHRRRA